MATLPYHLEQFALFLERFPGIGAKTAYRLALYALRMPEEDLKKIGMVVSDLKRRTQRCRQCNNLTEDELCSICSSPKRDKHTVAVVESVLDVMSMESGNIYQGLYHVLHGKIDPLNHIGPEDIFLKSLFDRIIADDTIQELIISLGSDMESESTALYIKKELARIQEKTGRALTVTRLAYGLPIGAQIEYADYMTLKRSLEGRTAY